MSVTVIPRITDRKTIEQIKIDSDGICEYVDPKTGLRCNHPALGDPHHIRTRGAGGDDIRENLIHLCGEHHTQFHNGNINRHHLIEVVAKREGKMVDEIYEKIGLVIPENIEGINTPEYEPTLEELIQAYIQLEEGEQESKWIKGQLLDSMINAGAKTTWLSSQLGISPAQIRELVKVYQTFPKESMRIPSLSWYHHRVAANSSAPNDYIKKANDEGLSTRGLRKVILKDEGKDDIVQMEGGDNQKKAEKVFKEVENIIAKGGESAIWLKDQLQALFNC